MVASKKKVVKKKVKVVKKTTGKKKAVKKPMKKVVLKPRKTIRKLVKKTLKKITKKSSPLILERSNRNPIISPENGVYWESKATFNPTALCHDGKIHVIYRAIGDADMSVLGYARSDDGYFFDARLKQMAYYHKGKFTFEKTGPKIDYVSGGGWGGGCEDPRLTLLGDMVYMLYTAFDGWGSVRIALTSIALSDFEKQRWNWKAPVMISPPGEVHKNWVLFPEKINGKYAILHSISPSIMIHYSKSLDELGGNNFIHSVHGGSKLWTLRDKLIRGVGPAPIHTKYGWLVFYHKMEKNQTDKYKLWAMILDTKDPTKILYNSQQPILEPDLWYENEGYKYGVVYSCGAVVKDGTLFVYYGGADKVSCVATADLDTFLRELVRSGSVFTLKSKKLRE